MNKPAFRLGIAKLRVGWRPHRLDVQVQPERAVYRAGERAQVRLRVVLPGELRRTLPAYSNEVVMMLHSTSLASAVPAMLDITAAASRIYSDFYLPFEAYLSAAALYLVGTFTLIGLFKLAERRYLAHLSPR